MTSEALTARRDQLRAAIEETQTRYERARAAARLAFQQGQQLRGALALCEELLASEREIRANGEDAAPEEGGS
jgi:hypothetical protein